MRLLLGLFITLLLSGCYGNWPALDDIAGEISCDMQRPQLESLAKDFSASTLWDEENNALTLQRFDDAILVVFDQRQKRLATVVKTSSEISLFGLIRSQGEVTVVLRCIKA